MVYQVTLKKRAIKALEKINEPYYSALKHAIYSLADTPRPKGYKKLKGRDGYRIRVADYRGRFGSKTQFLIPQIIYCKCV